MREHGIRRLVYRELDGVELEVELEPPAAPPPIFFPVSIEQQVKTMQEGADPDRCPCGHSISVEHNDLGCLLGCSNSLCASATTEAPEPRPN